MGAKPRTLTPDQITRVRATWHTHTNRIMAQEMHVSESAISAIRRGLIYKDPSYVPDPPRATTFESTPKIELATPCQVWPYPSGQFRGQRVQSIAWFNQWGEVPQDSDVYAHCDNFRCVRPDHLYLGPIKRAQRSTGKTRLSPDLIRDMRYDYEVVGLHITELAASYGVTEEEVRRHVDRTDR